MDKAYLSREVESLSERLAAAAQRVDADDGQHEMAFQCCDARRAEACG